MKLYETLEQLLKKEPNFVTDNGELKKWVVLNKAQNFDEELLGLLLDNAELKNKFFVTVKGTLVFNQNLFVQFLEQKNYLNDSYTQYKNKVGLTIDGKYLKQRNEVSLVWPFKDCILEGGKSREEGKREEIFFNEIMAQDEITQLLEPKVLTNAKRIAKDGEKPLDPFKRNENGTITDNLIIKGNNLLALHTLKEEFAGKVRLFYIDPPYNIGDDSFGYNDSFNHSTWLTFMKNRLSVAKELLMNSGSIWISIDDREIHYLKILCDEVFGRENKISFITVKVKDPAGVGQQSPLFDVCEYMLVYAKNATEFKNIYNKDFKDITPLDSKITNYKHYIVNYGDSKIVKSIERGGVGKVDIYKCSNYEIQSTSKINFDDYIKLRKDIVADYNPSGGMILAIKDQIPDKGLSFIEYVPIKGKNKGQKARVYFLNQRILSYLTEIIDVNDNGIFKLSKLTNLWSIPNASLHLEGDVDFPNGKKPELIFEKIFSFATHKNDLIVDFHVGSGSSCAVAHKMGRQYIGIEQMDYGENSPYVRLKNVIDGDKSGVSKKVNWKGGGDFVYLELKKYNQTFIEKIEEAKDSDTLLQIWEQMKAKSFLNYNVDIKRQDEHLEEFKALSLAEQKQHLCELLDKNQLYVNLSSLNDADFACTDEEKKLTKDFYQIKK